MGKTTICIDENKGAYQLGSYISFAVTAKLISTFAFATRIAESLFYLNPKFQVSSITDLFGNPNCLFSHAKAQFYYFCRFY